MRRVCLNSALASSALVATVAIVGCVRDDTEVVTADFVPLTRVARTVEIVEGPVDVAVPALDGAIVVQDGRATWFDGQDRAVALGPVEGALRGATVVDGEPWLLLDDTAWVHRDGALVDPGLPTVSGLSGDGADLWCTTPDGVRLFGNDRLRAVGFDGATVDGPLAPGGHLAGTPVTWIAHDDGVHALAQNAVDARVYETYAVGGVTGVVAGPVEVVVAANGALHTRREAWARTGVAASELAGGPGGAWIVAPDLRFVEGHALVAPAAIEGALAGVDALGRLLVLPEGGGASWQFVHRPLRWVGLGDGEEVTLPVEVELAAIDPDEVVEASVVVRAPGSERRFDAVGLVVRIDPVGLDGPAVAWAEATYADGTRSTSIPRRVRFAPAIEVTWAEHVAPIEEVHCARCHVDGADEPHLGGPEAWEQQIDAIVTEIVAGRMPLGGRPLSPGEVAYVEAWRDGGFLRSANRR